MSSAPAAIGGVLPVFQTPFHEEESIDFDTLAREVDWLLAKGCDGVVMAMVSEVLRMSDAERRAVAEHVCRQVRGRGHVVISVGAESSRVAASLASHAAECGASAVMAIPPVSVGCAEDELGEYFDRIFRAAGSLPVIIQDASGYVGRPMSIGFQASMLQRWGDRAYFKPEASPIGPRLSALRDATAGRARIFEGSGGIALVDSFRRGIVGTMPGADLIDAILTLWRALSRGDAATIDRVAPVLSMIVSMQGSLDSFLAIEKHLLVRQGVFANEVVRGPRGYVLDAETRREADRLFDLLKAAVAE